MEMSCLLLALLYATLVSFISKMVNNQRRPKQKLPPGPKPWPIIGNLNLLGSSPHRSLHSLSQKYGPIMLLRIGQRPVVVASSPEMARQVLRIHDTSFASRPALAAGYYISYNYSVVALAPYGPYWRQTRKIYLSELFNPKKIDSLERIHVEERRHLVKRLRAVSGKPVVLRDHLSRYTLATASRMLLSSELELRTSLGDAKMEELREMADEWFHLSGVFNIGDWIPWLRFFDVQGYVKKMKALKVKMDKFYDHVFDEHLRARGEDGDFAPKDVLDALLQIAEDPDLEVKLTRDCLKGLFHNLLVGGIDASAITVEWAVHELLRKPEIIKKAKEELDRVVGRDRWVEENDFSELPYIDAVIKETFRLHPPSTLIPHYAIEDCKVAGYDVAKGTTVLINAWSIGRDPESWDAPEEFLPERFIGKEIDMTGSNFALLPFGSGRRGCPGHRLGLKMVLTALANLLHGFELKLAERMRPQGIRMEEEYGLITHPKHPLSIIIQPMLATPP